MGNITAGSLVIGADGKAHAVLQTFPHKDKEIYKVSFSDGTYTRAGAEHLWTVCYWGHNRKHRMQQTVLTTEQIMKDYKRPHYDGGFIHKYWLPQQQPIVFQPNDAPLPIHPYLLGVLLGDGSFSSRTPCVSNPIPEIKQYIQSLGYNCAESKIYGGSVHFNVLGLAKTIRDMGLYKCCYNKKFVPQQYLFASPQDRLALLQGLMDTDGSVNAGKARFNNCNDNIINAVCWLARSLGMIATVSNYMDKRAKSAPCKVVNINTQVCPFLKEPNKVAKWKPSRNCRVRKIVDISPDGKEDAQCILVDSEDHTYLTRDFIITHNTFSLVAETIKRAYNCEKQNPQYLFLSPLAEQTEANILGICQGQAQAYIKEWKQQDRSLVLLNGATIWFGGARSAEKFRGRYLDGCVLDEKSQVPDYIINDIIHFCLMDRKGWLAVCGTARSDDDYKLYRGYKEALKPGSGYDLVMKIGCNESGVLQKYYNMDPVKAKEDYIKQAMANGSSYQQALQSWMCEMECDFSFIDEGRPNMNALLYNEMQSLFEAQPPRLLQVPATQRQTAVFDLASGGGRDYTTAVFVTQDNNISGIHYTNTKTMQDWITVLKAAGVDTVVLPFDAKQRNRDTGMSTVDFMANAGFRVIVLKRLLRIEQEEHARWLLNSVSFDYNNCVDALRELGKFTAWQTKHKLDQDVMSAICYAGQYVRKKGIKEERRKTWYQQMNQSNVARNNPNEQSNMMVGLSGATFF